MKTKKVKKKRLIAKIASTILWASFICMAGSMGGSIASLAIDKGHGKESQLCISILIISFLAVLLSGGFYVLVRSFKIAKVEDDECG